MTSSKTQVLVVGGGLVGLSSALFLAARGVDVVLLERHDTTSTHPRARGVNARTMEIFRSMGIEHDVRSTLSSRALAANAGVIAAASLAGQPLGELRRSYVAESLADLGQLSPTAWCLCDQDELEPLLRAAALAKGADVRFGHQMVSYRQDDDGVSASVRSPDGGEQELLASYLVAADGAHSRIRESIGAQMAGPGTLAHYMNIYFHADLAGVLGERRFIMCYVLNAEVMGSLLPVDNHDRWLLHVPFDPAVQDVTSFPVERCVELVRAAVGLPELEPEIVDVLPWEAAGRTADRWRDGRVFLVGDAAHVMPPTGAFGSNVGIQDAHNLAWKLAAVLEGTADPALLDSYESERKPVAEATVVQAVLRSKDRPKMVGKGQPSPPEGIVADNVVMLGYGYPTDPAGSLWNDPAEGRRGWRAPHLPLLREGRVVSTIDLYCRGFVLLCGADGPWPAAAAQASAANRVDISVHRIGPGGDLLDRDGRWAKVHGVYDDGAVLVRPDGFVCWVGVDAARAGELSDALAAALGRQLAAIRQA